MKHRMLVMCHLLLQNLRKDWCTFPSVRVSDLYNDNRTTVGAIDDTDTFAYFSNYGECVEIQAPVSSFL